MVECEWCGGEGIFDPPFGQIGLCPICDGLGVDNPTTITTAMLMNAQRALDLIKNKRITIRRSTMYTLVSLLGKELDNEA